MNLYEALNDMKYGSTITWDATPEALDVLGQPSMLAWLKAREIRILEGSKPNEVLFIKFPVISDSALKYIVMAFVSDVDKQAMKNMAENGTVSGAHNLAINQILRKVGYIDEDRN